MNSTSQRPPNRNPSSGNRATSRASRSNRTVALERIAAAPPFTVAAPTRQESARLAASYTAITGDRVTSQAKLNLLSAAYRVHGAGFSALLATVFRERGSVNDLLLELRTRAPLHRPEAADTPARSIRRLPPQDSREQPGRRRAASSSPESLNCGCPPDQLLPGLLYCGKHRPLFDPSRPFRHDRRASNPAASRFFPRRTSEGAEPETCVGAAGLDLVAAAYRAFCPDLSHESQCEVPDNVPGQGDLRAGRTT